MTDLTPAKDETNPGSDFHYIAVAIDENTRAGQSHGKRVFGADGRGQRDKRTYRLASAGGEHDGDQNKFDINESTGQIMTKAGVP